MIIDISQYNNVTDWDKVAKNVDGVIMRLGYRGYINGGLVRDKKFVKNYAECKKRGIPFGIYFVTQAISDMEVISECEFILANVDIDKCKLGIWLDDEYSTHKELKGRRDTIANDLRTYLVNVFIDYFKNRDKLCGLYTGDYWLVDKLIYDKLRVDYYWIARYGINNGTINKKPTHKHIIHQYTSVGKCDGIAGNVDLNYTDFKFGEVDFQLPNLNGYGLKIIEALEINGYDSSFAFRKKIAEKIGIKDYIGTAEQNLKMIEILR